MSDENLDDLLRAAREDRPTKSDEDRMERALLGAIAAGAPPLGRFASLKMFATVALVSVGVVGVVTYANHEERTAQQHAVVAPQRASIAPHRVTPPALVEPQLAPPAEAAPERDTQTTTTLVVPARDTQATPPGHARPQLQAPPQTDTLHPSAPPPPDAVPPQEPVLAPTLTPEPVLVVTPAHVPSEASLLSTARVSMRRHDASAALAAIAQHDERYPFGELTEEVDVLRIEALASLRRTSEVRSRAQQFAHDWPTSVYRGRIHAAVEPTP